MKARLKQILREKKGATYIEMVLLVIVVVMVIVLALNVFSFFTLRSDMEFVATEIAEAVSLIGSTDLDANRQFQDNSEMRSINDLFETICETEGYRTAPAGSDVEGAMTLSLKPGPGARTINKDGVTYVQLGDPIEVTVSCKYVLRALGTLSEAIDMGPLSITVTTLSRVYTKG